MKLEKKEFMIWFVISKINKNYSNKQDAEFMFERIKKDKLKSEEINQPFNLFPELEAKVKNYLNLFYLKFCQFNDFTKEHKIQISENKKKDESPWYTLQGFDSVYPKLDPSVHSKNLKREDPLEEIKFNEKKYSKPQPNQNFQQNPSIVSKKGESNDTSKNKNSEIYSKLRAERLHREENERKKANEVLKQLR